VHIIQSINTVVLPSTIETIYVTLHRQMLQIYILKT